MEELIDIVDENDNVIGQDTKKNAHLKKLWHRAAAVLLFKDESLTETLLQKRSKNKDQDPGLLTPSGGHLNSGETYLQGALRELHEEMLVGLSLPNVELSPLFRLKNIYEKEFQLVYKLVYSGSFNIDTEEVEEYFWVKLDGLLKDIKAHPEKYTQTCKFIFSEYQIRCPKPSPEKGRRRDDDEEEDDEEMEGDEDS
ncbi:NUDIX domain-containing protein [Candidatus Woesearchaeota archaeon]|nr:NUDIX domain-containing protein [Candidatus Woesearchaeota archaeon]